MELLDWLGALPDAAQIRWYAIAAGVLLAVLLGLFLELRWFARSGRAASWGVLRAVSLLAAVLAVASVAVPVQVVSGPVALAVFYAALLTVAPLIWFGTHLLVGRRLRPGFSTSECVALGVSGLLLMLVLPGGAGLVAEQALQAEVRGIGNTPVVSDDTSPLTHRPGPARRWRLPDGRALWTQHLQASPEVRLGAVQYFANGRWHDTTTQSSPGFCRHGHDLHFAWVPNGPPTVWRLHWLDGAGRAQRSTFHPDPQAFQSAAAEPFAIAFRSDGFDLPAPLVLAQVHLARDRTADGAWRWVALALHPQPGRPPGDTCVLPGTSTPPTPEQPAVQAVGLMLGTQNGLPSLAAFERSIR